MAHLSRGFGLVIIGYLLTACGEPSDLELASELDQPRGPLGKADRLGSCEDTDGADWCAGRSSGACWCDEVCVDYGDCCDDYLAVCEDEEGPASDPSIVYVHASLGSDGNAGTSTSPFRTIGWALDHADTTGATEVRVAGGIYRVDHSAADWVVLRDGIAVLGGYDPADWAHRDPSVHVSRIVDESASGGLAVAVEIPADVTDAAVLDGPSRLCRAEPPAYNDLGCLQRSALLLLRRRTEQVSELRDSCRALHEGGRKGAGDRTSIGRRARPFAGARLGRADLRATHRASRRRCGETSHPWEGEYSVLWGEGRQASSPELYLLSVVNRIRSFATESERANLLAGLERRVIVCVSHALEPLDPNSLSRRRSSSCVALTLGAKFPEIVVIQRITRLFEFRLGNLHDVVANGLRGRGAEENAVGSARHEDEGSEDSRDDLDEGFHVRFFGGCNMTSTGDLLRRRSTRDVMPTPRHGRTRGRTN